MAQDQTPTRARTGPGPAPKPAPKPAPAAKAITCAGCGEDAPGSTTTPRPHQVWLCGHCEHEMELTMNGDNDIC